jgi:hypothetical protein
MTASAAAKNLGRSTLVGLEISGHLIFPVDVAGPDGKKRTLLSGVGLLTGLFSMCAILGLGFEEEKIIEPFEPGFSKTFYVFFVDKTLHYRGSGLWNKDKELIEKEIAEAIKEYKLPEQTQIQYEDKEDENVLYINILNGEKLLGVIFVRNSGTEDKNAIYVKGEPQFEKALCQIGLAVQKMHTAEMKNKNRSEYIYEQAVIKNLEAGNGQTDIDTVLSALNGGSESDLFGVIHGLKKEGRVEIQNREITWG